MLSFMYSEDISIKDLASGDSYGGHTYGTVYTVEGAIFDKTQRQEQDDGSIIVTHQILNTNSDISQTSVIVYEGLDRQIKSKSRIYNHLTGKVDHYEYGF